MLRTLPAHMIFRTQPCIFQRAGAIPPVRYVSQTPAGGTHSRSSPPIEQLLNMRVAIFECLCTHYPT